MSTFLMIDEHYYSGQSLVQCSYGLLNFFFLSLKKNIEFKLSRILLLLIIASTLRKNKLYILNPFYISFFSPLHLFLLFFSFGIVLLSFHKIITYILKRTIAININQYQWHKGTATKSNDDNPPMVSHKYKHKHHLYICLLPHYYQSPLSSNYIDNRLR